MCLEVCVTSNVLTGAAQVGRNAPDSPLPRCRMRRRARRRQSDHDRHDARARGGAAPGCGPDDGRARADPGDRDRARVLLSRPSGRRSGAAGRRRASHEEDGRAGGSWARGAGDRAASGRSVSSTLAVRVRDRLKPARGSHAPGPRFQRDGVPHEGAGEVPARPRGGAVRPAARAHLHQGLPPHLRRLRSGWTASSTSTSTTRGTSAARRSSRCARGACRPRPAPAPAPRVAARRDRASPRS